MHPSKVVRTNVRELTDLPNIGKTIAEHLREIGIHTPDQLVGKKPYDLYREFCHVTRFRQDPCVLDVFISIVRFANGENPQPWWAYTAERKQSFPDL